MPKHPVLLVIHIMYGFHLSVTSFKKVEPKKNVYDGKSEEYELAMLKKIQYQSIVKK